MFPRLVASKQDYESLENDFRDYSNVVVKKPWGYEYLIYCNDIVAIWILHIQCGAQTSMHCHPNKKASLVVLDGAVRCRRWKKPSILMLWRVL